MPTLKLKFKIELIEKIQKIFPSSNQPAYFEEFQSTKYTSGDHLKQNPITSPNNNYTFISNNYLSFSKSKFPPHSKYSIRNSKTFINDIESIQGYDTILASLSPEEKEQLTSYIKSFDTTSLYHIFTLINSNHLYQKFKTKNGLEIIKNIYDEILTKNKPNSKPINEINDECELYICLNDVLNFNDIDCAMIFNLFKYNEFFSMNITHFILLIYFFLAVESKEIEDYIQNFGDDLFKSISANDNCITVARMKNIGNIVNIKEREMNDVLTEMNFNIFTEIDLNKFKDFYISIGKKIKTNSNQSSNSGVAYLKSSNNQTTQGKDKSSVSVNYGKFHCKRK